MLDPVAEPGEQDDEDPARAANDQQGREVLEDVLQQGEAGGQHAGTLCRYVSRCVCMYLHVSMCVPSRGLPPTALECATPLPTLGTAVVVILSLTEEISTHLHIYTSISSIHI